jgi:Flp pilus assembly protein CpaB
MSRDLLKLSLAVVVLSSLVAASTIAWSSIGTPIAEQANMTRPDFDRVFSDVASVSLPAFTDVDRETLRQTGLKRVNGSR